jgi:hypothetical protein
MRKRQKHAEMKWHWIQDRRQDKTNPVCAPVEHCLASAQIKKNEYENGHLQAPIWCSLLSGTQTPKVPHL